MKFKLIHDILEVIQFLIILMKIFLIKNSK
jgi:hypothetical protein